MYLCLLLLLVPRLCMGDTTHAGRDAHFHEGTQDLKNVSEYYLRELFLIYGEGGVLTPNGLHRLLHDLSPGDHLPVDLHGSAHVTHNHQPDQGRQHEQVSQGGDGGKASGQHGSSRGAILGKIMNVGEEDAHHNGSGGVVSTPPPPQSSPLSSTLCVGGETGGIKGHIDHLFKHNITFTTFYEVCPMVVASAIHHHHCANMTTKHSRDDHHDHHSHHDHNHQHVNKDESHSPFAHKGWIGGFMSILIIGILTLGCIMVIPALKRSKFYTQVNHFLISLAVGTLTGDALIHLLPHALMEVAAWRDYDIHIMQALCGLTSLGGIIIFLFVERFHNIIGKRHSKGHSHEPLNNMDDGDVTFAGGAGTEETPIQSFDKIGEKLSQHSKHNSFIYGRGGPTEEPSSCFDGCPPNLSPNGDSNGNNGPETLGLNGKSPRKNDRSGATHSECEKLVNSPTSKADQLPAVKLGAITASPLSTLPVIRQDSSNFNMVMQEYHVGHHGHSHHGHSHVIGHRDSLRLMIMIGDAMHSVMDGMAIGAAFGTTLTAGIATAIAVLCHELPHKVGDFALLFDMGTTKRKALKMVAFLWMSSLMGLILGLLVGSIKSSSPWVYSFTAGIFLYLALVDLLSEMSIKEDDPCGIIPQLSLQVSGMLSGAAIMLVIAIYEHDLKEALSHLF